LTESVGYSALRPAISICVLTKEIFPADPRLHFDFCLRDSSGLILTNDLQIHLLELSKLQLTEENVYHASAMERWAYFLRNAEKLTKDDVARMFPDREIAEAAGVLEMISQTPEERQRYRARLKFQRDEAARAEDEAARLAAVHEEARRELEKARLEFEMARLEFEKAHDEGRVEGRLEGVLIGRVIGLQELSGVAPSTFDELSTLTESELNALADQLQRELRNRIH